MRTTLAALGRRARSWRRRPLAEKLWFVPALLLLGLSRVALLVVPFRWISARLGHNLRTAAVVPLAGKAETARALTSAMQSRRRPATHPGTPPALPRR